MSKVTPAISRKEKSRTAKVKKTTTAPDQHDQVDNKITKPFKFVEDKIKTERWQWKELAKVYERKMLNNLLSNDPVFQVLKPKLIDVIQGPVSTPASESSMLEGIYGLMQLLHEAGFVADIFDVKKMLECDQDQITYACQSLYEKLIPITGKAKMEDQAIPAIADTTKEYHTGSSQHSSEKSRSSQKPR